MGRPEDRAKGLIDDIQSAQSEIRASAGRIARLTDDPDIIDRIERITAAAQRTHGYAKALREIRDIEDETRRLFLGDDYYRGTEHER